MSQFMRPPSGGRFVRSGRRASQGACLGCRCEPAPTDYGSGGNGGNGNPRSRRMASTSVWLGTLTAPGPGTSATPSIAVLPVAGTQKGPAAVSWRGVEPRTPAPCVRTVRASVRPNAPGCAWPGQKRPAASLFSSVPVVSGERTTFSGAMNCPGAGGQSSDVSSVPTAWHGCPPFGPALQLPPTQRGQGEATLPVRYTREESAALSVAPALVRSSSPHMSCATAFTMHEDSCGMAVTGSGSGGPKTQFASSAHEPGNPPQSTSAAHAPPVLTAAMQWRPGPAPLLQSSGPDPALGPRRRFRPSTPTTPRVTSAPSGTRPAGRAVLPPPPM